MTEARIVVMDDKLVIKADNYELALPGPTKEEIAFHLWERFLDMSINPFIDGEYEQCIFCGAHKILKLHHKDCIYIAARKLVEGE